MSNNETTVPIGDWTIGSLKVYEDEKLALLKQLMDERKEHLKDLRVADQRALEVALEANEKRLDLLNELRGGVATKEQLEALEKVVDELKDRLNTQSGKGQGLQAGWGYLIAIISFIILIANFLFRN